MKSVYSGYHRVSLYEDGTCTISRAYFSGILDYALHRIIKKDKIIRVSDGKINLENVTLDVDENKRVNIRGDVNHSLVNCFER